MGSGVVPVGFTFAHYENVACDHPFEKLYDLMYAQVHFFPPEVVGARYEHLAVRYIYHNPFRVATCTVGMNTFGQIQTPARKGTVDKSDKPIWYSFSESEKLIFQDYFQRSVNGKSMFADQEAFVTLTLTLTFEKLYREKVDMSGPQCQLSKGNDVVSVLTQPSDLIGGFVGITERTFEFLSPTTCKSDSEGTDCRAVQKVPGSNNQVSVIRDPDSLERTMEKLSSSDKDLLKRYYKALKPNFQEGNIDPRAFSVVQRFTKKEGTLSRTERENVALENYMAAYMGYLSIGPPVIKSITTGNKNFLYMPSGLPYRKWLCRYELEKLVRRASKQLLILTDMKPENHVLYKKFSFIHDKTPVSLHMDNSQECAFYLNSFLLLSSTCYFRSHGSEPPLGCDMSVEVFTHFFAFLSEFLERGKLEVEHMFASLEKRLITDRLLTAFSGRKWKSVGTETPSGPLFQINSVKLANALVDKQEFTQAEVEGFGMRGMLRKDDYILVGGTYYQPVASLRDQIFERADYYFYNKERGRSPSGRHKETIFDYLSHYHSVFAKTEKRFADSLEHLCETYATGDIELRFIDFDPHYVPLNPDWPVPRKVYAIPVHENENEGFPWEAFEFHKYK